MQPRERIIAINGRFLTREITGVERFAREIVCALDTILESGRARIIVPENARLNKLPQLRSISLVEFGKHTGHLWEQLDYARYIRREKAIGLSLCNTAPLFNPGVVAIHDMNICANPSYYSWKFRTLYRMMFAILCRTAQSIVTVSMFSKKEILNFYPSAVEKVHVIPDAWQHIERVTSDEDALERFSLTKGGYYFAMSSLAPNKNLKWLVETARLNSSETFVIAGGLNPKVFGEHEIPTVHNVRYVGYVSDEEAKALMEGCKAFIYPTFYEGFGMPPLEALACGAPIIASDTEVMHEVYGDAAAYINPNTAASDLNSKIKFDTEERSRCLSRFSWDRSAKNLLKVL